METHVDALRQARRDRLVGPGHGDLVVTGGGWGAVGTPGCRGWSARCRLSERQQRGGILSLLYGGTDYMNGVSVTRDRPINEGKGVGRKTWPKKAREMVKRARDAAGARAREIGGIEENRQQHIRSMKDYLT